MVELSCPPRKRVLKGKRKRFMHHVKGRYRGRKNQFQNYHTSSPLSQIANNNFNSSFPTRKPMPQTLKAKNQTENFPKKNYQRVQEILPLNKMYQKLLSIAHVALEPLAPL